MPPYSPGSQVEYEREEELISKASRLGSCEAYQVVQDGRKLAEQTLECLLDECNNEAERVVFTEWFWKGFEEGLSE